MLLWIEFLLLLVAEFGLDLKSVTNCKLTTNIIKMSLGAISNYFIPLILKATQIRLSNFENKIGKFHATTRTSNRTEPRKKMIIKFLMKIGYISKRSSWKIKREITRFIALWSQAMYVTVSIKLHACNIVFSFVYFSSASGQVNCVKDVHSLLIVVAVVDQWIRIWNCDFLKANRSEFLVEMLVNCGQRQSRNKSLKIYFRWRNIHEVEKIPLES